MQKPVEKPIKFVKNLETKGKSYPVTHVSAVIDDENKSIGQLIANLKKGQTLIETTGEELKTQRDNGELLVGSLYRLTDVDGNAFPSDSPYYGHLLDVVLIATSPNTLSEEGWVMMHLDTYKTTFEDGVIKDCYIMFSDEEEKAYNIVDSKTLLGVSDIHKSHVTINEEDKTASVSANSTILTNTGIPYPDNYFQNKDLEAWKIWYNIDTNKIYKVEEGPQGGITKITWQELKDLRDNSQLTPGALYRITDYQCTTTQENTRSAGHQFDIVLLALSEDKLAEEGWAIVSEAANFAEWDLYTITFADTVVRQMYYRKYKVVADSDDLENVLIDSETLKGFHGVDGGFDEIMTLDSENNTGTCVLPYSEAVTYLINNYTEYNYNYFQNSNLSAWKVWYCLDNDKSRFAWADDSVDGEPASINITHPRLGETTLYRYKTDDIILNNTQYYCWYDNDATVLWTLSETPQTNDKLYHIENDEITEMQFNVDSYTPPTGTQLPNGRGVIYRLIDEWNNDCPYDFKNVLISVYVKDGQLANTGGSNTFVYTFNLYNQDYGNKDASIFGQDLLNDENGHSYIYNNSIKPTFDTFSGQRILEVAFLTLDIENDYIGASNISVGANSIFKCNRECYNINVGNSCIVVFMDASYNITIHNGVNKTFEEQIYYADIITDNTAQVYKVTGESI